MYLLCVTYNSSRNGFVGLSKNPTQTKTKKLVYCIQIWYEKYQQQKNQIKIKPSKNQPVFEKDVLPGIVLSMK